MCKTLYMVIPCFNEEAVLQETASQLDVLISNLIKRNVISNESKVLFVDDGSTDKTWEIIKQLHIKNNLFLGISLSRNCGEQNAYLAGMMTAKDCADMVITMDADLQDDLNAIHEMISEYYSGNDIVYGVRSFRNEKSFFKPFTAGLFYKTMKMMGTELIPNHSQYRLMSKRALEALSEYNEVNLFLPALIPLLGFKSSIVYHKRVERFAGKSKYSVKSLFSLAFEAITSFSIRPIRLIGAVSILFLLLSLGIGVYTLVQMVSGNNIDVYLIMASVWVVGSAVLAAIAIVGEYAAKSYMESKQRPRYHVTENLADRTEPIDDIK